MYSQCDSCGDMTQTEEMFRVMSEDPRGAEPEPWNLGEPGSPPVESVERQLVCPECRDD